MAIMRLQAVPPPPTLPPFTRTGCSPPPRSLPQKRREEKARHRQPCRRRGKSTQIWEGMKSQNFVHWWSAKKYAGKKQRKKQSFKEKNHICQTFFYRIKKDRHRQPCRQRGRNTQIWVKWVLCLREQYNKKLSLLGSGKKVKKWNY